MHRRYAYGSIIGYLKNACPPYPSSSTFSIDAVYFSGPWALVLLLTLELLHRDIPFPVDLVHPESSVMEQTEALLDEHNSQFFRSLKDRSVILAACGCRDVLCT